MLELLLASGCSVDARGEGGQTALLAATEEGLGSCVERLIDHGADVNKANFEGANCASHSRVTDTHSSPITVPMNAYIGL